MMNPEASRRLGHALQAISSIQRYTANPLQEILSHDLTRSAVQRQLGIVQEALVSRHRILSQRRHQK